MLDYLKALVVILPIAWVTFVLARPMCLAFMPAETFTRRRNVWFALTIAGFLSPEFWVYASFAFVVLFVAGKRDENPLALFVLVTFTVPPAIRYFLPGILVNQLFDLTQYRILSLAILLPAVLRIGSEPSSWSGRRLRWADVLLLAFLLLQLVLTMQYESITNTMRRAFLLGLDTFIVFYVFSRLRGQARIADVMVCFALACVIMAPIAVFESAKGWLLYTDLANRWGDPNEFAWIARGDLLRAQAASGHSLNLGYVLAMSLGLFLYLRSWAIGRWFTGLAFVTFAAGLFVSGSRGPMLTAAVVVTVFVFLRPNARQYLGRAALSGVLIVAAMYLTPLKEQVLDRLPLIGTVDQDNVDYRQQLLETSWPLIMQNPFFGNPFVYLQMESLRQGQGIIDIVNGYLYTALFSGLVGLLLQMGVFALAIWQGFKVTAQARSDDPDSGSMGAALLACMLGTMFYIGTAGLDVTAYIFAALLLSYASSCKAAAIRARPVVTPTTNRRASAYR